MLERERLANATVARILDDGGTPEECVRALVTTLADLQERYEQALAICPVKIRTHKGQVFIWRCPDELIPERCVVGDAEPVLRSMSQAHQEREEASADRWDADRADATAEHDRKMGRAPAAPERVNDVPAPDRRVE